MSTENLGPRELPPTSLEPTKAQTLVKQLVAAGRWPEPDLLRQILNEGDEAVEPLRALLRTDPRGWPAKAPLVHAIRLLGTLHPPSAIPELVSIIRRYRCKLEEEAARALARFDLPGFDALIELYRDPEILGYRRIDVALAAKHAAGADPIKRARIAEVLRSNLERLIVDAREIDEIEPIHLADDKQGFDGGDSDDRIDAELNGAVEEYSPDARKELDDDWDEDDDLDEVDDLDEDEYFDDVEFEDGDENDLLVDDEEWGDDDEFDDDANEAAADIRMEIALVVSDLADMADPLAGDLIKTAFEKNVVDTSIIDQDEVDAYSELGATVPKVEPDWLDSYQKSYDKHVEATDPPDVPPPISVRRPRYRYEDRYDEGEPPPDTPATAPIQNTGPRLGRNDPCWCGSGKKYKRCHLGKEPMAGLG